MLKCKRNLYKSTYKGNAFIKNKEYKIVKEKGLENYINLIDEKGNIFNFTKEEKLPYYYINDYFYIS